MKHGDYRNVTKKYDTIGDNIEVVMLAPPRNITYSKRPALRTSDKTKIKELLREGWDAMLARHYDERIAIDFPPPRTTDNSRWRGITDHIYNKRIKRTNIKPTKTVQK